MVKVWDQEVCSLCDLRFEPCGCSYDGHWRLTWSLTSEPVELVEVRAKKKKSIFDGLNTDIQSLFFPYYFWRRLSFDLQGQIKNKVWN
jgi:hypothetical protein